jgi:hypothetical protein
MNPQRRTLITRSPLIGNNEFHQSLLSLHETEKLHPRMSEEQRKELKYKIDQIGYLVVYCMHENWRIIGFRAQRYANFSGNHHEKRKKVIKMMEESERFATFVAAETKK